MSPGRRDRRCRLPAISVKSKDVPVVFASGRARLRTNPAVTGSPEALNTIGMLVVACRAASVGGVPLLRAKDKR
jgi:hypothetical protein